MAKKIKVISAYAPRIKLLPTVSLTELIKFLAGRTGLNQGEVNLVMNEFEYAVYFYHRVGRPVKLPGLGTYSPGIKMDGTIRVGHRSDSGLKKRLNDSDGFEGTVLNNEHVGKSLDDLVELWNTEHPDDLVEP